jgi:DNA polymerase III delta prime subunit
MNNQLLHPKTKKDLDNFIAKPSHGLIITGQAGTGKKSLAVYILSQLLKTNNLSNSGQAKIISPVNNSISIDQIRQVQEFIKLKTLGTNQLKRAIIIENAELMGTEAQNALLKLLEEPPADTVIVLTCTTTSELLPTISSRAQKISVQNPNQVQIIEFFTQLGKEQKDIEKAYFIGEGRTGLISAILNGQSTELTEQISAAKQTLGMNQFDRLKQVDSLSKDKAKVDLFLQAMEIICSSGLKQAVNKNTKSQIKRWHSYLKSVVKTQNNLNKQANTKLLLTNLMLSL